MRHLYDVRMQALLAAQDSELLQIGRLLAQFAAKTDALIRTREAVIAQNADLPALVGSHQDYVTAGFQLMLELRQTTLTPANSDPGTDQPDSGLATLLASSVEEASLVFVPAGEQVMYSWIAIWWVARDEEAHLHSLLDPFATALDKSKYPIDMQMLGITRDELLARCTVARFANAQLRDDFIEDELPALRTANRELWVGKNRPHEITL